MLKLRQGQDGNVHPQWTNNRVESPRLFKESPVTLTRMPQLDCSQALRTTLHQQTAFPNRVLPARGGGGVARLVAGIGTSSKTLKTGQWKRALSTILNGTEINSHGSRYHHNLQPCTYTEGSRERFGTSRRTPNDDVRKLGIAILRDLFIAPIGSYWIV